MPEIDRVILVSNLAHEDLYRRWVSTCESRDKIVICCTGARFNEERKGAVDDIRRGFEFLLDTYGDDEGEWEAVIVVAGDTLLPLTDIGRKLDEFVQGKVKYGVDVGVSGYTLERKEDCESRGMLSLLIKEGYHQVVDLVEKPKVDEYQSMIASAPVYVFSRGVVKEKLADKFLEESKDGLLKERDAPGYLIKFLCRKRKVMMLKVEGDFRIDIGNVDQYKLALRYYQSSDEPLRMIQEPGIGWGYPRVGLLGNPSDGYGGQTISFAVSNLGVAQVIAYPPQYPSQSFSIVTNPEMEHPEDFSSIDTLTEHFGKCKIGYGAKKLVIAGTVLFQQLVKEAKDDIRRPNIVTEMPCTLSYSSSIPKMRGLAGSSALIWATVQSLCIYYRIPIFSICEKQTWPEQLLRIEQGFLNIAGGLQDRVIQVHLGLVYMDFRQEPPKYVQLDNLMQKLPPLYIAYRLEDCGSCSGVIHKDLRKVYDSGDPSIRKSMKAVGELAEEGKLLLEQEYLDCKKFGALMERNFLERLNMLGNDGIGKENLDLITACQEAGFSTKYSGSGGAVVAIRCEGGAYDSDVMSKAMAQLSEKGIYLKHLAIKKNGLYKV